MTSNERKHGAARDAAPCSSAWLAWRQCIPPTALRSAPSPRTPPPARRRPRRRPIAVAEAYFAAFNAGDADALGALLAPDYRHQGALVAKQDREIHINRLRTNRTAFPDGHYDLQDVFAEGDLVVVRHVFTGTLQGPYAGVEPQGQPVAVRGVHIHRVACGQIVETWNSGDGLGLLRQIGALPGGGPVPAHAARRRGDPGACRGRLPAGNGGGVSRHRPPLDRGRPRHAQPRSAR